MRLFKKMLFWLGILCFQGPFCSIAGSEKKSPSLCRLSFNLFLKFNKMAAEDLNIQHPTFEFLPQIVRQLSEDEFQKMKSKLKNYVKSFREENDHKRSASNCWIYWKKKMRAQSSKPLINSNLEKHFNQALLASFFCQEETLNNESAVNLRAQMDDFLCEIRRNLLPILFEDEPAKQVGSSFVSICEIRKKIKERKDLKTAIRNSFPFEKKRAAFVYLAFLNNVLFKRSSNKHFFFPIVKAIEAKFDRAMEEEEFCQALKDLQVKKANLKSNLRWVFHAFHWGRGKNEAPPLRQNVDDAYEEEEIFSKSNMVNVIDLQPSKGEWFHFNRSFDGKPLVFPSVESIFAPFLNVKQTDAILEEGI